MRTISFSQLCGIAKLTAKADTNWVQEDLFATATGNVLKAISHNKPKPPAGTFADAVDQSSAGTAIKVLTVGTFKLKYGTLTLKADGSYTYKLFTQAENASAFAAIQHLTTGEVLKENSFVYKIAAGALNAQSTLNLTVFGANDGVKISGIGLAGGDELVFESALPQGQLPNPNALTQQGTFKISAPDGLDDLKVGTLLVIENGVVKNLGTPITTTFGTLKITAINLQTGTVSYTYTLLNNASHSNGAGANTLLDSIALHLADRDGSAATSAINIKIVDDLPTIEFNNGDIGFPSLATFEQDGLPQTVGPEASDYLFVVEPGADGLKSVAYALSIPQANVASGLVDTATGKSVVLALEGGAIVGRAGPGGAIVLKVTVNATTGELSFQQLRGVVHDQNGFIAFIDQPAIILTATATDNDGDKSSLSLEIGSSFFIFDSTPDTIAPDQNVVANAIGASHAAALDVDGNVDPNYRADGGNIKFAAVLNGANSGLTSDGLPVSYAVSSDGHTLTGTTGNGTKTIFTVTLNLDGSSALSADTFTVTMFASVNSQNQGPISFELPLSIIDGDGDTNSAALSITLAPHGAAAIQDLSAALGPKGVTASATIAQPDILGSNFNDDLSGDNGNNTLFGDAGADVLAGGGGIDLLIGGADDDTYRFASVTDSPVLAAADTILDFNEAAALEKIDVSAIDAIAGGADEAFVFTPFETTAVIANQITWARDVANNVTIVQADVSGDATADFVLKLAGLHILSETDFVL